MYSQQMAKPENHPSNFDAAKHCIEEKPEDA